MRRVHSASALTAAEPPAYAARDRRPSRWRGWALAALLALLGHALAGQLLLRAGVPPAAHARPPQAMRTLTVLASPPSGAVAPAMPAPAPSADLRHLPVARAAPVPARLSAAAGAADPVARPGSDLRQPAAGVPAEREPATPKAARPLSSAATAMPAAVSAAGAAVSPSRTAFHDAMGETGPGAETDPATATPPAQERAAELERLRELPVYPTRLPPAFERHFVVQRGEVQGEALLRFEPQADGAAYRLHFAWGDGQTTWLTLASGGLAGPAGLLPQQFTDRRPGRSPRSSRFDREAATVQVGPRGRPQPLATAGQDRLSWWVQLPAIVRARPDGPRAGERLSLQVAGVRGVPAIWHFDNRGLASAEAARGPAVPAWHYRREPTSPYDLQVDVWLDPRDAFLPVQVAINPVPGTGGLLFRRLSGASTPASNAVSGSAVGLSP